MGSWRKVARVGPPVLLVVDTLIRIAALITVPRNKRPSSAVAWLMAIFIAPVPGSLLYAVLGDWRLPKDRRDRQQEVNTAILDATEGVDAGAGTDTGSGWFRSVVHLNRKLGAMPLLGGNEVSLLADYDASLAAMTQAVRAAERYVHAEFYILSHDASTKPFFDALREAHLRGVTVRVLYDQWATLGNPRGRATREWLRDAGIPFQEMLPLGPSRGSWRRPDLRNHRKILVVDGGTAFTGSQNLVDSTYNKRSNIRRGLHWKDLMIRVDGPAALGLQALFVTDWYSETGELLEPEQSVPESRTGPDAVECQVVPSGPGFEGENNLRLFNSLVYGAQDRLTVTSPYFVPDDSMLYAITTAAQRGVEVELFACAVADQYLVYHAQRSYYEILLRAGVRIFLYREPTVLHSKFFTVDDDIAVVGSSNMDMRSFSLNYEVSVMVRSAGFVRRLREIQDDYREQSREITLDEWLTRPPLTQVLENVARLTASVQ